MGSFNVGCGLSNLAIHERDKVGLLLLNRKKNYLSSHRLKNSEGIGYQVYVTDNFSPFLAPIFGVYDDYGRIGEIQESVTTKLLEEIFHKPIQVIADCAVLGRSIYYTGGAIYENYATKDNKIGSYSASIESILLSAGFEKVISKDGSAFSFEGFTLSQPKEGVWAITNPEGKVLNNGFVPVSGDEDVLSMFGEYTGIYPGFKPEDYKAIRMLHEMSAMFFLEDVLKEMSVAIEDDFFVKDNEERFIKNWDEFQSLFGTEDPHFGGPRKYASSWGTQANEFLSRTLHLEPYLYDLLHVYKGNYELFTTIQIIEVATTTNRMIAPSICGEQNGNDRASKALNVITDKILDARLKEYGEDW